MNWLQGIMLYAFAGIWAEVWRFGLGFGCMILLFAAAYFSPIWKKDFLWAGVVLGVAMVFFTTGVVVGEKRVRAQWMAAEELTLKANEAARADAERTVSRKPPGRMRNDRSGPDCRDCENAVRGVAPHHLFQR